MTISHQISNTNAQTSLVAPLADFNRASFALVGGKGANLGELIKAGLGVPAGFVITTAAYDLLFAANGLRSTLHDALASLQLVARELQTTIRKRFPLQAVEQAMALSQANPIAGKVLLVPNSEK